MAAYAEGLAILENADAGAKDQIADAETAPLSHAKYYQFDIDVPAVSELWRRGSVVASWLLDLTAAALVEDPKLESFQGRVSD
jgi:6-phosphogluconate dehydrogenase